jgi:anti-sigma B factor antagonist
MAETQEGVLRIQSLGSAIIATVACPELTHETSMRLQQQLDATLESSPASSLVLDLTTVSFVPSLALGILVGVNKRLRQADRRLFLVGLKPDILEVFSVTGLLKMFDVRPTVGEAIQDL